MEHATQAEHPGLYPGEILDTVCGFPTISYYSPIIDRSTGKAPNPLIVCVTGGLHLARPFYGGHEGSKEKNFLTYWLNHAGFNVLSLSYPTESDPEIMPPSASGFRIPDWGKQAATTAKKIIDAGELPTSSIVLISWSMGGRMVVPFNISARELGLDVQQYIAFAASPGLGATWPLPQDLVCSKSGYFFIPSLVDGWSRQLSEMEEINGGQEIIPRGIYRREYLGAAPVNLIGLRLAYDGSGSFIEDRTTHEEETKVFDIANFPLISSLFPTSVRDSTHALVDRATWGFFLTYKLESMIQKQKLIGIGEVKWGKLLEMIHQAPERLCRPVEGNHFFFIGEKSACDIAGKVVQLIEDGQAFQEELLGLLE